MVTYSWQLNDWPDFQFSTKNIEDELLLFSEKVCRVTGILEALPDDARMEVVIDIILAEALKTSAIYNIFPFASMLLPSGSLT